MLPSHLPCPNVCFASCLLIFVDVGLSQTDAKTQRFKETVLRKGGTWREAYGVDEKKVAQMVREDKIDILVELTGHTANNRLGVMACRPAPVQVRLHPYDMFLMFIKISYIDPT